jgi:STAS domain
MNIPVVVDCSRISQTDFTAAESFKAMMTDFKKRQIQLYWLRPADHVADTLGAICGPSFR